MLLGADGALLVWLLLPLRAPVGPPLVYAATAAAIVALRWACAAVVSASTRRREAHDEDLLSLGTLAAGAAHELRTPLTTMAVAARELERGVPRGPAADDVRLIRGEIERCRRIVSTMSGRAAGRRGEEVASTALEGLVAEVRARAAAGGLVVRIDEALPPTVRVPREGLSQALACLVRNAIDASPAGLPIVLAVRREGPLLVFEVDDRGCGVPRAVRARLGRPFVTTKGPEAGTGIGLFLARAFAERRGGRVTLEPLPGAGTRATLAIPAGAAR